MRQLPTGTVTFLFTDIEGSTRLLHALGERYAQALTDHRRLLRAAFTLHRGVEVDTQGDSFFIAFADPSGALAAAEEAQRALSSHAWPEGEALRVRMGLHTGEPLVVDGHYVGIDVHRAARIAAAAHGGQVIVSERTTRLLLGNEIGAGTLRELGGHRLKDLPEPERLFQLVVDDLPSSFPPLRVHEETIEAAGLPDYSLPPADVPCPYKGLLPFEPEDSELYFGREQLVEDLAARLMKSNLLAVVGPSGSGKSSLVRAGVVPALRHILGDELRVAIFSPGTHPFAQLAGAREASLLVVDQLEEVFTLCRDEQERRAFVDALLGAAEGGIRVAFALRADFYGHCAAYPRLASALEDDQALVGPMSEEELRRAIERPAEQAGLLLEPGMVEGILRDVVGQPGALPLLSHSLLETWRRRSGRMLTLIGYLQSGGVQGAIAQTAEAVFHDALSVEQQALARNVFLRLTELGDGTEDTRRRVSIAELVPRPEREAEVREVIRTLADARLVTVGEGTVEVAHEALIRHWPTLREWLDEDREGTLLHRRLTEAAQEWQALGRDPGTLFRGARLATTGDWATAHDPELNQLERDFLTASRQASQLEAERQRRVNRRLRGLVIGIAIFLAVALVAAALALVQRSRAQHAQSKAEAQALMSDAERLGTLALAEPNPDRALLLAVAGFKLRDLPETRGDLLSVLERSPALIRVVRVSRTDIPALTASQHGGLLASGDSGGVVRFNDLRTWRSSGTAVHIEGAVSQDGMEFSPDGGTLAVATTGADDRSNLYLVDVAARTSRLVGSWPSVPAVVGPRRFTRMAFSPDGRRLAVAVATAPTPSPVPLGQRLLLLASPSGRLVWERNYPLRPGQNEVSVAFTPQGALLSSAQQGETLLWDVRTGRIKRRFDIGGPFAVSPEGRRLAVVQNNANPALPRASLAVLDLQTGRHRSLRPLPVPGWIVAVRFAAGGVVVGRSFDWAVRVWNLESGSITETYSAAGSGLNIALADGRTVVAGARDGTLTVWDLAGARRLGRTFQWHPSGAGCVATPCFVVEPYGSLIAESLAAGRVGLADLRMRRRVGTLPARNGPLVDALAFLPDGRTLATGGANAKVTLWDVRERAVARTLRLRGRVWWAAASPNGKLLALQTQTRGRSSSHVEVLDLTSGRVLYHRAVPNGKGGVEFSPDGREIVALGCCEPSSTIVVWSARSGKELFRPRVDGHAMSIAFSPDGRLLLAGTEDGKVVLWDARDGSRQGAPVEVATGGIETVSFSPDGRLFVASSDDGTATLWESRTHKRLANAFPVEEGSVPVARFMTSGDVVINNVRATSRWPIEPRAWVRFACRVAGRDLTRDEWSDLLPDRPYRRICPQ
jgi:WD40 repeat protein/class 3 adenylate cyclase